MKPLNWIVENGATDVMAGFALQLTKKYDKNTGMVLALQTDWGFPFKKTNGKVYQKVVLVPGKYKLSGVVKEAAITGKAYLAVANNNNFAVTTDNISNGTLSNAEITSTGVIECVFEVTEAKDYSIGFVATLNEAKKFVKFQSFIFTYLGEE